MEKRSYQYNKLYSTIDLQYAITLYFELLRAFLDIPPLSIVGPSGTQSTSSSLPPNTILIVLLVTKAHTHFTQTGDPQRRNTLTAHQKTRADRTPTDQTLQLNYRKIS